MVENPTLLFNRIAFQVFLVLCRLKWDISLLRSVWKAFIPLTLLLPPQKCLPFCKEVGVTHTSQNHLTQGFSYFKPRKPIALKGSTLASVLEYFCLMLLWALYLPVCSGTALNSLSLRSRGASSLPCRTEICVMLSLVQCGCMFPRQWGEAHH